VPVHQVLRKNIEELPQGPSPRAQLPMRAAESTDAEVPSPAAALQQELDRQWSAQAGASESRRWSPRSTLIFSTSISLALWAGIAAAWAALR
jgi:hypothetical protein